MKKTNASGELAREQIGFGGLKLLFSRNVYSPREDSELLAEAVKQFAFGSFLDLGCGCGVQSIVAAKKSAVEKVVGIDLNPGAVEISRKNAEMNGVGGKCVFLEGNLFSPVKKLPENENNLGKFDSIAFNPPYLPTAEEEKVRGKLNLAFDGGLSGRELMDKFISQVKNYLKPNGIVLLVSSSLSSSKEFENGNDETRKKLEETGFACEVIGEQKFFFEELVVFRARLGK